MNEPKEPGQVQVKPPPVAPPPTRPVVPIGTITVVGVLTLTTFWLWMLILGIQQGRG